MRSKALLAPLTLGLGAIMALVWFLAPGSLPVTSAAHIGPVNTTDDELNDGDDCSLREAIQAANTDSDVDECPAGGGDDTITLPSGTYTLTIAGAGENSNLSGDLDIYDTDALTITGAGPGQTIINANTIDRAVHIGAGAGPVVISGVTILNGNFAGYGGGIRSQDTSLTLINTVLRDNTADYGGGLYVYQGSATLIGGQVLSNSANFHGGGVYVNHTTAAYTQTGDSIVGYNTADTNGGGVYVYQSSAWLNGGRILGNTCDGDGGGVYVYQGRATLNGAQVLRNTALGNGGGVYVGYLPNTTFTQTGDSTVTHNHAVVNGGGVYIGQGSATLSNGQFISNTAGGGGGLYVSFATAMLHGGRVVSNTASRGGGVHNSAGTLTLDSTIVSGNTATGTLGGGGVWNATGVLNLVNTTVSHNTASASSGGGIRISGGTSDLTYATVASNTATSGGDGIYRSGGAVSLINTILAYNGSANCSFKPTSGGYNLEDSDTCSFDASGDITSTDPLLGPLTFSGGSSPGSGQGTWVHPLRTGSPAIDQGSCLVDPTVDQRGMTRPQGSGCDIGAYEAVPDVYLSLVLRSY